MDAPVASKQAFFYRVLQEINLPCLPVEFWSFYGSSCVVSFFPSLLSFLPPRRAVRCTTLPYSVFRFKWRMSAVKQTLFIELNIHLIAPKLFCFLPYARLGKTDVSAGLGADHWEQLDEY